MTEGKTQVTQGDALEEAPEEAPEEQPEEASSPYRSFATEEEYRKHLEHVTKERVEREQRKNAEAKQKAEREAREKALQDQEDYKNLAEERGNVIATKDEELSTASTALEVANERVDLLEGLVKESVKERLELVPEMFRSFLEEKPVEEQADWLNKNAEKLGPANGNGSGAGQRPSGSRPTGRPAPVPKAESDKEARESQKLARVSTI